MSNATTVNDKIFLKLYVVGMNETAQRAFVNLEEICETHFSGKYKIEVVDLKEHPGLAAKDQIFAVPTVVKIFPLPVRKVIGDLSDLDKVLKGLELSSVK